MRLYCPKCSLIYDNVMGDTMCPICGTEMETKPRANRVYDKNMMTAGDN